MSARALLLYNPEARHAPDPATLTRIRRRVEWGGLAVEAVASKAPGDLSRLAALAEAEGFDRVVICGGDGSVREAAQGLKGSPVPLAIIPMGTANVLSREIGLPSRRPIECAAIAGSGKPRPVTLGEVAGVGVFTFCASAGIDSLAVKTVDLKMKRETGAWAYVHAGLMGLLEQQIPLFNVELPSGKIFRAQQVLALNASHYGLGSFHISRGASLEAPTIRMLALAPPLMARLSLVSSCLLGKGVEDGPGVVWADVDSFRISAEEPFPVQADGDDIGSTPCTVKAAPKALNLVFPE
jgi:diacylglycerol kinase family enzyme